MRFLMSLQPLFIHNAPDTLAFPLFLASFKFIPASFENCSFLGWNAGPTALHMVTFFLSFGYQLNGLPLWWRPSQEYLYMNRVLLSEESISGPDPLCDPSGPPTGSHRLCMSGLTALCSPQLVHCRLPEGVAVRTQFPLPLTRPTVLMLSDAHLHF